MGVQDELQQAIENAIETYQANKNSGSPAESLAFDNGRIDGLKQALEILRGTQ